MPVLVYTFRTFPFSSEIQQHNGELPFVFGKLKEDLEEFKKLILEKKPELILGLAKSPYSSSIWESKAINKYNIASKVIKAGPEEYELSFPKVILPNFRVRNDGTDSFCNWTCYQVAHFISENDLPTKLMFCHVNEQDIKAVLGAA